MRPHTVPKAFSALLFTFFLAFHCRLARSDLPHEALKKRRRDIGCSQDQKAPDHSEENRDGRGSGAVKEGLERQKAQADGGVEEADEEEGCGEGAGAGHVPPRRDPPLVVEEVSDEVEVVNGVGHLADEDAQADGEVGEAEGEAGGHVEDGGEVVGHEEHVGCVEDQEQRVRKHVGAAPDDDGRPCGSVGTEHVELPIPSWGSATQGCECFRWSREHTPPSRDKLLAREERDRSTVYERRQT
mmetsp:Transcript_55500/g.129945  ORF Transcript_55500/g.129945 Transcript_55500/m.129945 type:complete len:242 (-) Transcript_55500:209-934(-)